MQTCCRTTSTISVWCAVCLHAGRSTSLTSYGSPSSPNADLTGNSKLATKNADGRMDGNHPTVYASADIFAHPSVQLTRGGLILIGLLSGGDYQPVSRAVARNLTMGLRKLASVMNSSRQHHLSRAPNFPSFSLHDMRPAQRATYPKCNRR